MSTVTVHASRDYHVEIGSGILSGLGQKVRCICGGQKAAVISDSNVFPLYGSSVVQSLSDAGYQVSSFVFPAGESSKNGETYLRLLDFLAKNQLTRSDSIIALGGGVVGDLTGFAAATYLRGISFIQIPTTLLAAVDSSVGGKTAIDLPAGKNLAGAFYQPRLVVCDLDTLETLPETIFRDGCAEVIKYGILYDPDLFAHLQLYGLKFDREKVITRCVELKRDVVARDEFDTGCRMFLNLGHTIGHGIEAQSGFTISHGQAVSMGMAIVTRAGAERKICPIETAQKVISVLRQFGLPVSCNYSAEALYRSALSDKKRSGSNVSMIIPRKIGKCILQPVPVDQLKELIQEGL